MTTHKDRPLFWFIDHGPADGVEFFDRSDEVVAMKRGATPLYANPVTPAAHPVTSHGTTLVSPEESRTVQALRARIVELEAAQTVAVPDERKAAEHAYVIRAFDYAEAPVGSRDWTLFWSGWQERAALSAPATPAKVEKN